MLINGAEGLVADPLVFVSAARAQHGMARFLQSICLPSFQSLSMDEADSSDSDRSANRFCSFSTKFRCVVGSSSFSTAMGGEVFCGKEQRFKRSEQVAATRRWSVLLPQSVLRYTRQLWTMFQYYIIRFKCTQSYQYN